ncbi:hypothetical protein JCM10207_005803 [Rhodosporidiobolus poonsookiae]
MTATIKVAVPQVEPCWFDAQATVAKSIKLMEEAAANGARIIAFGELWCPGYPSFLYGGRMNDIYGHVIKYGVQALELDGPELKAIGEAAKKFSIITHFGFAEREGNSLYMANAIFDENGKLLLHRRKLKPSHYERILFGEGGRESAINVVETSIGRVSVMNCWEHFQPLLKYATYSQRPLIHIAAWPMLHPHGGVEQWSHSNASATGVTRTVACESGAFVLCASNTLGEKGMALNKVEMGGHVDSGHIQPGGGITAIYGPDGRQLSRDLPDDEETIIYADIDPDQQRFAGMVQDVVGHYSRPDIFTLYVNAKPTPRVVFGEHVGAETLSAPAPSLPSAKEAEVLVGP